MKVGAVIVLFGVALLAHLYFSGQLQIVDGSIIYVAPPSHEEEYGHDGHEHGHSFCQTARRCAAQIAEQHQQLIGPSADDRPELRAVRAEGVQVLYDYYMLLTKAEFELGIPPPDEWLEGNKADYCVDELNWPMTDLGVIVVMRFYGSDKALLGQVHIDECVR